MTECMWFQNVYTRGADKERRILILIISSLKFNGGHACSGKTRKNGLE